MFLRRTQNIMKKRTKLSRIVNTLGLTGHLGALATLVAVCELDEYLLLKLYSIFSVTKTRNNKMFKQYLTLNHKLVSHSKYEHKYGTKMKNLDKKYFITINT